MNREINDPNIQSYTTVGGVDSPQQESFKQTEVIVNALTSSIGTHNPDSKVHISSSVTCTVKTPGKGQIIYSL